MKDLQKKTKDELKKILLEKQEALRGFRFGVSGSKVRNVREGRNVHKEIAQIQTARKSMKN